jgi:hypothetical protein
LQVLKLRLMETLSVALGQTVQSRLTFHQAGMQFLLIVNLELPT